MHLHNIFGLAVAALAGTTAAMPRLAGPYHGQRIAVSVPANATTPHNASTTATGGKAPLTTGTLRNSTHAVHGTKSASRVGSNDRCDDLCSLEAHTCTLAVPQDDKFW